jgi:hypothetical protein
MINFLALRSSGAALVPEMENDAVSALGLDPLLVALFSEKFKN